MPMILSNLAPIGIEFSYLIFEFTFVAPHFTLRHFHLFQQIFNTCQQEDKCILKCFYLFYIVQMIECLANSRKPLFRHEMIRNLPSLNLLRCNCLFIWNLSLMCQTFYKILGLTKSNQIFYFSVQLINEKPQVIQEYESGKAIPNQQILTKLERALGVKLRGKKWGGGINKNCYQDLCCVLLLSLQNGCCIWMFSPMVMARHITSVLDCYSLWLWIY